ncbi:membrane protein [Salmonella enterica subsp. enterica serovar Typhimurium]|nr:membrane protein [Salmonella enterica subsp. enterica serovar Typhimurium]
MFYLQNVAQLSPAAAGSLMIPWSIASFVAIMLTGRYFNRLGPRPLIIVGCLLQAAGILLLTNVTPATSHRVLMMIFALMGGWRQFVQQYRAEWRFPDYCSPGHA